MCLNNEQRKHRTLMIHYLIKEGLIDDGYVSYLRYDGCKKLSMVDNKGEIKIDVKTKQLILPWEDGTTIDVMVWIIDLDYKQKYVIKVI